MDPRLAANRLNWDDRVAIHTESEFYDVDGWLADAPGPPPEELAVLGDVAGKTLVHLQCHFGMDTLRWARVGAMVTGLDFSPAAIREATLLAQRAGLSESSTFVCSDVYDAPAALSDHRFDVVYVSLGALCWLPDVAAWGEVVARLLNPGGRLYLHDVHPFSATLDDEGEQVAYSYFTRPDQPIVGDYDTTYTDGAKLTSTETYEWIHPMGAVVESLISRGLVLDSLVEHDWTVFQQFPWLESDGSHRYFIPEGRPRIPLTFTVLAHAPG